MLLIEYKDGDETEWHVWFMFVYGSYILLSTSGLSLLAQTVYGASQMFGHTYS